MKILDELCNILRNGETVLLATIVGTSGSTPAPADSKMIVYRGEVPEGPEPGIPGRRSWGTIGGGCLDGSVLEIAAGAKPDFPAQIMRFQLDDELGDTGLNCGGTVEVMVELVGPAALLAFETVQSILDSGDSCFLVTHIAAGGSTKKSVCSADCEVIAGEELPADVHMTLRKRRTSGKVVDHVAIGQERYVVEMLQARPRVLIFGGGHVGRATAECASLAGFHVTIVDDRPGFANKERFPRADAIVCEPFEQVCSWLKINPSTYVVIVTRGHKHDALVLEQMVQQDAKYIGMIGSRRKVLGVYEGLRQKGIDPARLEKVHAPIGLEIGAVTAEEIGVSVVAELIAVKRGMSPGGMKKEAMEKKF